MTGSGASPEFITPAVDDRTFRGYGFRIRSEEHTSELQSRSDLVCRLLLEKKKKTSELQIRSEQHKTELQSRSDIVCSLLPPKIEHKNEHCYCLVHNRRLVENRTHDVRDRN